MIIQVYNGDMEQLGLFEVQESNPKISLETAEKEIERAFIRAQQKIDGHDEDDIELVEEANEILMYETN